MRDSNVRWLRDRYVSSNEGNFILRSGGRVAGEGMRSEWRGEAEWGRKREGRGLKRCSRENGWKRAETSGGRADANRVWRGRNVAPPLLHKPDQ